MKESAKKLARMLFGEYSAYLVYSCSAEDPTPPHGRSTATFRVERIDESAIDRSREALIRAQAPYAGTGSHAYACFDDDHIVGVCFYWFGKRYEKRNYWPLANGEAKLVQIFSIPQVRGRGVANMLIAASCQDLMQRGFHRAYARIWYANTPSLRAFERAGWIRIAFVLEINPFRRSAPTRIRFDVKSLARWKLSAVVR